MLMFRWTLIADHLQIGVRGDVLGHGDDASAVRDGVV